MRFVHAAIGWGWVWWLSLLERVDNAMWGEWFDDEEEVEE